MQNDKSKFKIEFKSRLYRFAFKIIGNQLLRSGTSIVANYIESTAASLKKDFILFFTHSLKSANESKFWIGLLRDCKKADEKYSQKLLNEVTEIANVLASSILTLKGRK